MTRLALLFLLPLAACTTVPPPKIVTVPVAVPCLAERPDKPALVTADDLLAMTDYQLTLALYQDRLVREGYEAKLEAAITACLGR